MLVEAGKLRRGVLPTARAESRDARALGVVLLLSLGCAGSDAGSASAAHDAGNADANAESGSKLEGGSDGALKCVTCAQQGLQCGTAPDGCGAVIECGACTAPEFCGGGGPNRCGTVPCNPETCVSLDACGVVKDGCSGTLTCPGCWPPETCGGGGMPGRCGCTTVTCEQQQGCGVVSDGCFDTISCPCSEGQTCVGGKCTACGEPGQPCCEAACNIGYCYEAVCQPTPQLITEAHEGQGCGDLGVAHTDYLAYYTVVGRPGASVYRFCKHASCASSAFAQMQESPLVLGTDGKVSFSVTNVATANCQHSVLGLWDCYVTVDNQESNHTSTTYYNSTCSTVSTCALASGFCPG